MAKSWGIRVILLILIAGVMFSRMFLGVHTPADVLVSFAVSGVVVIGINMLADRIRFTRKKRLVTACLVIAAGIAYLVFTIIVINSGYAPYGNAVDGCKGAGAGIAFAIGWYVESTYIDFDPKCRHIWQHIPKAVIGAGGILLIRSGIKAAFGTSLAVDTLRYFLIMIWAMIVMPVIIKRFFNKKPEEKA